MRKTPRSTLLVALLTLPSLSMGMNVITHSLPLLKIHSRYSATPLPSQHQVPDPLPPPVYEAEPVQHVQPAHHYVDPYATHEQTDYEFVYSVKAPYHGDDHSHQETKTGDTTAGQYRVALPDGRMQIVTYRADNDGYQATVEYEGEQHYDPPIYNEPAPSYHPEPTPYHPEPIPYHPEPTIYHHQHPEPPPYHPEPTGFHLEAKTYQPEPPSYLPEPPSYHHPEPFSFHPEPPHEPVPQHPIEPTYHPSPAPQYHHPSQHSTLYHPSPAPLHHGPLRRYGMLRPVAPKKYSYSPTPTPTPAPKYSYSPTPTPAPDHRPYAYSPTPFPAGPKVFRPHPTAHHPIQYKSKITYENHPKEVKEVVRSMPSLLPSFTPSPASLELEGFTARPAITLDPEQDQDPQSSSLLLDPEEIHQLPDLEDNHL